MPVWIVPFESIILLGCSLHVQNADGHPGDCVDCSFRVNSAAWHPGDTGLFPSCQKWYWTLRLLFGLFPSFQKYFWAPSYYLAPFPQTQGQHLRDFPGPYLINKVSNINQCCEPPTFLQGFCGGIYRSFINL